MNVRNAAISILDEKDIDEVVMLVNSAYRGESSKQGWTTEADLLDGVRTDAFAINELRTAPGALILVYRNEAEVIEGCVYLHKQQSNLYLGMLTVSPTKQAKGIGKKLLQAADEYAQNTRCDQIVMTVIDVRDELIAWYSRHGYNPTGETKPFPADPAFGRPRQPLQFVVLEKKVAGKHTEAIRAVS